MLTQCCLSLCYVSAGAVTQLLVAALSNVGKLYITTEGAAKTHINNAISAKAAVLEALLGELMTTHHDSEFAPSGSH
jgi:hypothetical protein